VVAASERQGEAPTLRFNATMTTIATAMATRRKTEKREERREMKLDTRKREQGMRLKPCERTKPIGERPGRSKTNERLEIQYRCNIHRDRREVSY